jgi:hypothetical protein
MIYLGFALMVWHWLPFLVLAWVWGGLFTANMMAKEASMSRYLEWAAYKARTHWVIPTSCDRVPSAFRARSPSAP